MDGVGRGGPRVEAGPGSLGSASTDSLDRLLQDADLPPVAPDSPGFTVSNLGGTGGYSLASPAPAWLPPAAASPGPFGATQSGAAAASPLLVAAAAAQE